MQFQFSRYVLDVERRELRNGTEAVMVEPQVFDLLLHVIHNRDRVVSKDELVQRVWHGRIVSDSTLDSRINAARRAVGDSGSQQSVIRTFSRKGIRFVADVMERAPGPPLPLAGAWTAQPGSVAVLPLTAPPGDALSRALANSLADTLATDLSQSLAGFAIVSGPPAPYLLHGSVQRTGTVLRVNIRLMDAATGMQLWADRFDGREDDLGALEDMVTARIAASLNAPLVIAESRRVQRERPDAPRAADLVLRARELMAVVNPGTYAAGGALLREATSLDPTNAYAWAGYAQSIVNGLLNRWEGVDFGQLDAAEDAVERAVTLDPRLPYAHCIKGLVLRLRRRHDAALSALDRAVALNPHFAFALLQGGLQRTYLGHPGEALPAMLRALEISPRDSSIGLFHAHTGLVYFCLGRHAEAIPHYARSVVERPDFMASFRSLVALYAITGRKVEAAGALDVLRRRFPASTIATLRTETPFDALFDSPVMRDWQARYEDALRTTGLPEA